jgi:hypothetical protein
MNSTGNQFGAEGYRTRNFFSYAQGFGRFLQKIKKGVFDPDVRGVWFLSLD